MRGHHQYCVGYHEYIEDKTLSFYLCTLQSFQYCGESSKLWGEIIITVEDIHQFCEGYSLVMLWIVFSTIERKNKHCVDHKVLLVFICSNENPSNKYTDGGPFTVLMISPQSY